MRSATTAMTAVPHVDVLHDYALPAFRLELLQGQAPRLVDLEHPRRGVREPGTLHGRQFPKGRLDADQQVHSREVNGSELMAEHALD